LEFIDRYGWRALSDHERRAATLFYATLGRHMGLRDIPTTYKEFVDFFDGYEHEHVIQDPANRLLMAAMHEFNSAQLPKAVRGLANGGLDSLLPDHIRAAIGIPRAPVALRAATQTLLRLRAVKARFEAPADKPWFVAGQSLPSYPDGYDLAKVGPPDQEDLAKRLRDAGSVGNGRGTSD
jgi:uncharacterized protein (DUF2236 family)